jgi:hypothetical protein
MSEKTVTLEQFIQAIEDNGLPQAFGTMFDYYDGIVIAACALGQAKINLDLDGYDFEHGVNRFSSTLWPTIVRLNDGSHYDLKKIAHYLRSVYYNRLDENLTFRTPLW